MLILKILKCNMGIFLEQLLFPMYVWSKKRSFFLLFMSSFSHFQGIFSEGTPFQLGEVPGKGNLTCSSRLYKMLSFNLYCHDSDTPVNVLGYLPYQPVSHFQLFSPGFLVTPSPFGYKGWPY